MSAAAGAGAPAVTVTVGSGDPAPAAPAAAPATPAAAPAAGQQAPAVEPPKGSDDPVLADSKALQARLDRERAKTLREFGASTPEEMKAKLDRLNALEQADKDRQLAAMTEQERTNKILEDERNARKKAEDELVALKQEQAITSVIHAKGIKNVEYARFLVDQAKAKAGGAAVDFGQVLGDAMGDQRTRIALGIDEAGTPATSTQPAPTPASTSPATGTQPKPLSGTDPAGPKDMRSASDEEWQAFKKANGLV